MIENKYWKMKVYNKKLKCENRFNFTVQKPKNII